MGTSAFIVRTLRSCVDGAILGYGLGRVVKVFFWAMIAPFVVLFFIVLAIGASMLFWAYLGMQIYLEFERGWKHDHQ